MKKLIGMMIMASLLPLAVNASNCTRVSNAVSMCRYEVASYVVKVSDCDWNEPTYTLSSWTAYGSKMTIFKTWLENANQQVIGPIEHEAEFDTIRIANEEQARVCENIVSATTVFDIKTLSKKYNLKLTKGTP